MKNIFTVFFLVLSLGLFASSNKESVQVTDSLTIYAYDSFCSDWGPGPSIVEKFQEKYGINVTLVDLGDAGSVLTRAISEKNNPQADIIIGIDNNMLAKAVSEGILDTYKSNLLNSIPEEYKFSEETNLAPFDYGYFSIIYDSTKIKNPPKSLEDLTKTEFKDSLILMDPRTSSPGLGFLLWTISVYKDKYLEYWDRLQPSILTISDGWTSGYGLFTAGEAPMVLSYSTSPSYHVEYEDTTKYKALIFDEGNYMQIEGMGILKGAKNIINATIFLDFMLQQEAQNIIPLTNFMFPVNKDVVLPKSFDYALVPNKSLQLDYEIIEENYELWISDWSENIIK